jgi:hypothetical protein
MRSGAKHRMYQAVEDLRIIILEHHDWPLTAKKRVEAAMEEIEGYAEAMSDLHPDWRPVEKLEGIYEVSVAGSIRRIDSGRAKTVNQRQSPAGYMYANFSVSWLKETRPVHQIVAEHFLGARPSLSHVVNHKDGDRTNNHASNLEWVTQAENVCHAIYTKLKPTRKKTTITPEKHAFAKQCIKAGMKHKDIAKQLGIPRGIVDAIQSGSMLGQLLEADFEVSEKVQKPWATNFK